jgi:hypothetical protein
MHRITPFLLRFVTAFGSRITEKLSRKKQHYVYTKQGNTIHCTKQDHPSFLSATVLGYAPFIRCSRRLLSQDIPAL